MQNGFEKRFNQGDIVYWCHCDGGGEYSIHYVMVDEQFSDAVCIDYLVPRERRRVDGVPIDEFQSEQRYRKLPKGWTYNTKLFELTWDDLSYEESILILDVTKTETIKEAYDKGYLVKDSTIFHGVIEDEITKDGFRIVKNTQEKVFIILIMFLSVLIKYILHTKKRRKKWTRILLNSIDKQVYLITIGLLNK